MMPLKPYLRAEFFNHSLKLMTLAALALAVGASPVDAQQRDAAKERELIALLKAEATPGGDKAIACKQLALHGGAEAVPALAPLLSDEKLASWARIALEAIPGPEAAKALREASSKLNGRLLIGVLNSIGVRRDEDSVEALAKRIEDKDSDVAGAAALALGRIGGEESEKLLRDKLAGDDAALRTAAAEACILCAEHHLAAGHADQAAEIYDAVRMAQVAKPRVLEATRGAILAKKSEGIPLLLEQLNSSDVALQRLALTVAREVEGPEVSAALTGELKKAKPELAAYLLMAIADRGDRDALPAVLEIAKSGEDTVRVAAAEVLLSLGDASSIPVLLDLAQQKNKDVADAAHATLAAMQGEEINAAITSRLNSATGPALRLLIELVGERRLPALEPLRKAMENSDEGVRHAALTALGETIEAKDLGLLVGRLNNAKYASDLPVVQQSVRAAAVRMPDREAVAKQLVGAMSNQPTAVKSRLLEILSEVGGSNALQAMRTAALTNDNELKDTSSRLLGSWFDVDAGPVLLELAQQPPSVYTTRAMRGYIRLARQFTMSDAQRADMCRKAMKTANRAPEQKLVIEVMERYPSPEMLSVAVESQPVADLKDEARRAVLTIAAKLPPSPEVDQELAKIGQKPVKLEIIKAEYGAGEAQRDVTEIVRKQVRNVPLIPLPAANYNASFGGDPAPNATKQLKIQYRLNGKAGEASFAENAPILLN